MVASTSCQRGGVALLDLIVFTITAGVCRREQVLRNCIKFIALLKVKVRVALMDAQTRCTSFVRSFACIVAKQIPVP
jgi:hypothetical protein